MMGWGGIGSCYFEEETLNKTGKGAPTWNIISN